MAVKQYFAKSSPRFTNVDAQIIGPVLASLAERGPVTARDVLEAAHSLNSPLRQYFEWDDVKAAEQHRLSIAREMVKTVRVRIISSTGTQRGRAAQKITVRSQAPTRFAFTPAKAPPSMVVRDSGEKARSDLLMQRSLDPKYYPDDVDAACDIIDVLREMLAAFTESPDEDGQDIGMTGKEAKLYRFLKAKKGAVASKQNIMTAIYGVSEDLPEIKIVDVFVCKLRRKLPAGEQIETVWGQGYRYVCEGTELEQDDGPKRRFTDHAELDPENVMGLADNHPAIVEGRTLFPSTVVAVKDSPKLLVSGANSRKLGDRVTKGPWSGFPIFQLSLEERATCPRDCHVYNSCYGNGTQMGRRHRNDEDLIPYLRAELIDLQDEFPRGFVVRLHVLGDFYSVAYVEAWRKFLREFPALHVFGYTAWQPGTDIGHVIYKITETDWDRFAIRFSSAQSQPQGATVIHHMPDGDRVTEGFVCPAQTDKVDCCGACGWCWNKNAKDDTVVFIAHGRTKKAIAA